MGKKKRKRFTPESITAEQYAGLLAAQGVALLDVLKRMEARTDDPQMVAACQFLRPVLIAETLNAAMAAATGV